jgi:hypothetical protein
MRNALLPIAVLLAVLLARLDADATSFADLVRWENVPAFLIYTALFWLVLRATSFVFARAHDRPGGRR